MFTVTYETISPECDEYCENDETGFVLPGDWQVPIDEAMNDKNGVYTMSLRDALDLAQPDQDSGRWFTETGSGRCNYATGVIEYRAIHPPENITPSSYKRLKRLLRAR
jgi:hypothetical protein